MWGKSANLGPTKNIELNIPSDRVFFSAFRKSQRHCDRTNGTKVMGPNSVLSSSPESSIAWTLSRLPLVTANRSSSPCSISLLCSCGSVSNKTHPFLYFDLESSPPVGFLLRGLFIFGLCGRFGENLLCLYLMVVGCVAADDLIASISELSGLL